VTGGDELIGHWSVEHGYHTSMEDEWLMFRADGSGWYAHLRPWFSHIIEFRWTRLDARFVRVEAYQEIELDEQDGQDQLTRRSLARVEGVACELARAQRPQLDDAVDELRIGLSFCLGSPFALVDRDEPERDFLLKAGVQT
jgi:hypothetical protein